ncbi:MAG TPA: DUF5931 domain-containing protein [Pseudonocardiaceae bacterium]|nr:DUF5931 domain-containing protein [Pseudonocardiaceae bacterium]
MGGAAGVDGSFWRAIAVFRVGALCHAALAFAVADAYHRPVAGWFVIAVMALWTAVATVAYARSPGWSLLAVDLAVTLACLASSAYVYGSAGVSMPVTAAWVATPVLAWAVFGGRRAALVVAAVIIALDFALRGVAPGTINAAVLLLLAALTVGHVSRLARRAEERMRRAVRQEAAARERERLARGIHDSVLQVLALVQRRGSEIGGEAAELGRLAGEQERALRELVRGEPAGAGAGLADLGALLRGYGTARVTVSTAVAGVPMPADRAREVAAAVAAALDNVRRHAGDGARAWILVEADDGVVTVTVRDDGVGMPDDRLRQAAAEGRIGVAESIVGRIADLGGTVEVGSAPGGGVEIELSVPVHAASRPAGPRSRP